jgi:hypothetical protein
MQLVRPEGDRPLPEDLVRLNLSLTRLYHRAAELAHASRTQTEHSNGQEKAPHGWQASGGAGGEEASDGCAVNAPEHLQP